MESRRESIRSPLLPPIALALARNARAQTPGKISKTAAQYQDTPKNGQVCGICKH